MVTKAVVTTLDNLPILKEQINILRDEPIDEIIIVNNGSIDGTREWLDAQTGITVINRENHGAGPGRNAGIDAAGEFDYLLLLDGGIRPLRGGTAAFLDYLTRHPEVDVVSPEVATCYTTDENIAWRRIDHVNDEGAFPQRCLSGTAYCLTNKKAWDGQRFAEDGPFGQKGWGVDDNDMAFRWNDAGILHHDVVGLKVYRHQSGSFARLHAETGIYPNQYGSVYEQRNVLTKQRYFQYYDPQWLRNDMQVSCVILGWNEYPMFTRAIKALHDDLADVSHEVIFVDNGSTDSTKSWLDTFALRWHWSTCTVHPTTGEILNRHEHPELEKFWTGDVIRVDLPQNIGTGAGYNAGFEISRGKYIFYLAGDILPVPGSVIAMYRYLEENPDTDFLCINAWCSQHDTEDVKFDGFRQNYIVGLGEYAYAYSMMRREIWDSGVRMADYGPFAGKGCGYEEAEFASLMYEKGFFAVQSTKPEYYHHRRDFVRSGHDEEGKNQILEERRKWLRTRWPGINIGYQPVYLDQPVERHKRRVAVVYKASPHRPGPGGHILLALRDIAEAYQFEPGSEPPGFDDYLYIDNGDYDYFDCPDHAHPSIFWAIDMVTPQQDWRPKLSEYVRRARSFDRVYAAQTNAVDYFIDNGIYAKWLPLAANPDYHKPYSVSKEFDWIALWHNTPDRIPLVEAISKTLPNGFVGYTDGDEYARKMSSARATVHFSRSDELALRVFEAMAIGVPLVCDRCRDIDKLFIEGTHYIGYDRAADYRLVGNILADVIGDPLKATAIAAAARDEVLKKHTYYHRALEVFGGHTG